MKCFRFVLVLVVCFRAAPASSAESFPEQIERFFESHCFACHGGDTPEAGLRLDTISRNLDDAASARRWEQVFDKVSAGEMPPKSESRPANAILQSLTSRLGEQLHQASLRRQQRDGRVLVRRLDNVEYENTLHDLLGMHVPLQEPLPADAS